MVSVVQCEWSTSPWVKWGVEQTFVVSVVGQFFSITAVMRNIIATVEVMGTEKSMVITAVVSVSIVEAVVSTIAEVVAIASVMMEEGSIVTVAVVAIEGSQVGVVGITCHHRHHHREEHEQSDLHGDSCWMCDL